MIPPRLSLRLARPGFLAEGLEAGLGDAVALRGGFGDPGGGLLPVGRDAVAVLVGKTHRGLRVRIALKRCFLEPADRLRIVQVDAEPVRVEMPDIVLAVGVALDCRLAIPSRACP